MQPGSKNYFKNQMTLVNHPDKTFIVVDLDQNRAIAMMK